MIIDLCRFLGTREFSATPKKMLLCFSSPATKCYGSGDIFLALFLRQSRFSNRNHILVLIGPIMFQLCQNVPLGKILNKFKCGSNHRNIGNMLEAIYQLQSSCNFIRMFAWINLLISLKMGHVGSKTSSLSQI